MPSAPNIIEREVIIIGGGFSGTYLLKLLRDQGFSSILLEANERLGGVWTWSKYPGIRVDSELPYYGYSDPKIWSTWRWTERFSSGQEIRRYFEHVDQVWKLSADVMYNTEVVAADWHEDIEAWSVKSAHGQHFRSRWLITAIGTSSKRNKPNFKGQDTFQGATYHSSSWTEDVDLRGKRIAIIGSGSTGVQIMQESAKVAARVVQYSRTPNYALPMRQRSISEEEIYHTKAHIPFLFGACRKARIGLAVTNCGRKTFDDTEEERQALWEENWKRGGFNWSQGGYTDTVLDPKANRAAYDFWRSKVRARITDPVKADILAPLDPPYWILTKRPSLEQDYFESCDRPNVELINSPIVEFTEKGIIDGNGSVREFDIVAFCTGYDAVTGGLRSMGIRGRNGLGLDEKWRAGVQTHLGSMVNGFPNMFILYGPQGMIEECTLPSLVELRPNTAPTSLSNGPTFIELQCEWVRDVLCRQREEGIAKLEAKQSKEEDWVAKVHKIAGATLLSKTDSWYMGAGTPGKPREFLLYMGGIPAWHEAAQEALQNWDGFDVVRE